MNKEFDVLKRLVIVNAYIKELSNSYLILCNLNSF